MVCGGRRGNAKESDRRRSGKRLGHSEESKLYELIHFDMHWSQTYIFTGSWVYNSTNVYYPIETASPPLGSHLGTLFAPLLLDLLLGFIIINKEYCL